MRRRSYLVSVVATTAALAGCGRSPDAIGTTTTTTTTDTGGGGTTTSGTDGETVIQQSGIAIKEGEYESFEFSADSTTTARLEVQATTGPALDCFVFTPEQFDAYQAVFPSGTQTATQGTQTGSLDFEYVESLTILNGGAGEEASSKDGELDAGDYRLVIDNTEAGEADPSLGFPPDLEAEVTLTFLG